MNTSTRLATEPGAAARPDTPAVQVERLQKTYPGGVRAVQDIDFRVSAGEVFGLLGPNGAGKSTTIGMLTTTIKPSGGRASLGGFDVATQPRAARSISSVVFQDPVVDRPLTGRQNLEIHTRLWGLSPAVARSAIADAVDGIGLADVIDRAVGTYSGGQRRRLEIARALTSQPQVLFMDEPTVGLDPRIRHELLDVIAGLRERSAMTIVLTTHYLDEAERLCDRIAIMHLGRIVALDTPHALLAGLGTEVIELRVAGDPTAALDRLRTHGIANGDAFQIGSTLTLPLNGSTAGEAIAAIDRSGIETTAISSRQPTLDDVYLRLTGDSLAEAA